MFRFCGDEAPSAGKIQGRRRLALASGHSSSEAVGQIERSVLPGDPCGVIHPVAASVSSAKCSLEVMKSEEGMLYVPDAPRQLVFDASAKVRPMVQSATDATLCGAQSHISSFLSML